MAGYDIYVICETHLTGDNGISVPGYTWYGHNRIDINPNAIRGSGGVGFLIADKLLLKHSVDIIDRSYEGIFWIRLTSKDDSENGILLCACYLPPEGSSRGNTAQEFYDTLITQTYMHYDGMQMYYLGDFNGRIGDKDDFNSAIDNVMKRHVIDKTTNRYGGYLIDFLSDVRCCTVNSRGDTNKDNFTSVSPQRGRSVVDYIITPYDLLQNISNFKVTTVSECIDMFDISKSSRAKVPDHSLLSCSIHSSLYEQFRPPTLASHTRRSDVITPTETQGPTHRR